MRVVKARAALLSDLEVLQLLRETEEQQKTQARHRKEETDDVSENDVPPNLRTIQFEGFRPCSLQKPEHVRSFLQALDQKGHVKPDARILEGEPGLTKGERLQLVNHAPASIVELHTLIEELGQRMSDDQIADILDCVVTHLPIPDTSATAMSVPATTAPMPENTEGVQDIVMDEAEIEAAQDAFPEDEFEHEDPNAGASAQDDDDD